MCSQSNRNILLQISRFSNSAISTKGRHMSNEERLKNPGYAIQIIKIQFVAILIPTGNDPYIYAFKDQPLMPLTVKLV